MPRKRLLTSLPVAALAAVLALAGALAVAAAPSRAPAVITQTVTLAPLKDNTLYESATGALSNGAGQYLFAGQTANDLTRRAALAFDLSGLPAGATVTAATLTLSMSKTIAGETPVTLHALQKAWGEGASDALGEEGAGAAALTGDAT
uniref:DNRLRE domain-containing protein n=1 Tax=Promineifilum sp. TaxID=2664178 RepID=UPI0035B4BD31